MADFPGSTVLHHVGEEKESGGVLRCVRQLETDGRGATLLGVTAGAAGANPGRWPTLALPAVGAARAGVMMWCRARPLARAVQRWLADGPERLFHAHTSAGLAAATWLERWGQRRTIASVHGYERQKWFHRWAARRLGDRLFWLSPAMKRYYRIQPGGEGWAQCIPPAVTLPAAARAPRSRETPAVVRVGGIGPLVSHQCWHLVLDALAAMPAQQRWKIRFEHVGAPEDSPKSRRYQMALRSQTGALSLGNLVKWAGAEVTPQGLLATADVLILPSIREPLSLTMLEALAAGVPVLAAGAGGARDVIVPARNGWLFRAGDPRDLARLLVMLAESDALSTVTPVPEPGWRFSTEVVVEQWARVHARVLALEPGGALRKI